MGKRKYKGVFNYQGEIHTIYRYGVSSLQVKQFMVRELAKKLGKEYSVVRNYFLYLGNKFEIEEVK
jgi:hypothetical protein